PVALYTLSEPQTPNRFGTVRERKPGQTAPIAFFALDRARPGTVPVHARETDAGMALQRDVPPAGRPVPLFHGLAADTKKPPASALRDRPFPPPRPHRACPGGARASALQARRPQSSAQAALHRGKPGEGGKRRRRLSCSAQAALHRGKPGGDGALARATWGVLRP